MTSAQSHRIPDRVLPSLGSDASSPPGPLTLALPARLRLPDAVATLAELRQALARADDGPIALSLAGLWDSDSAVIAVLLAVRREFGERVSLTDIPDRVRSLARLYGLESVLLAQNPLADSPQEAG